MIFVGVNRLYRVFLVVANDRDYDGLLLPVVKPTLLVWLLFFCFFVS